MIHYDHGMVGATVALAVGAQRRFGWPAVLLAAVIGMFPDWDATPRHISREMYWTSHRVWGHNLFAVTLAGAVLGGLGYLIHESVTRRRPAPPTSPPAAPPSGPWPWIILAVLIMWTHPFLDVLYSGPEPAAVWPVALLWPIVPDGLAVSWVPSNDWGATVFLAAGLLVAVLVPRQSQRWACVSLALLAIYIGVRGAFAPR